MGSEANNLGASGAETQGGSHLHVSATNPEQVQREITRWQRLERGERWGWEANKEMEVVVGFRNPSKQNTPHGFTAAAAAKASGCGGSVKVMTC